MEHRSLSKKQRLTYGIYQLLDDFLGRKRVYKMLGKRREKFHSNLFKTIKAKGEGRVIPIERRKFINAEEFRSGYLVKGKPVVLEGVAKDWACVKEWSLDYLKEQCGNDDIVLYAQRNDKHLKREEYEILKLSDIIDNIYAGGKRYYRHYPFLHKHPELCKDFDMEMLHSLRSKYKWADSLEAYIGGKDTPTHMHNEALGVLFTQVHGEKKWTLYPPEYSMVLDPEPAKNVYRTPYVKPGTLMFNPHEPDYEVYPECNYLDRYETTLRPGDILWTPPYYWHEVVNTCNSIGVAYKWFSLSLNFTIAPFYTFLDVMARHPPIWKSLKLFKQDFNQIILSDRGKLKAYLKDKTEKEKQQNAKPAMAYSRGVERR